MINTALGLIYQELQKLQIDVPVPAPTPTTPDPQSQPRHHSHSPQPQGPHLPAMGHILNPSDTGSGHVSPVHHPHHAHHSSHPSSSMGTPGSTASAPMLQGYSFPQQTQTGFDLSSHHQSHQPHHHHNHSSTGGLPPLGATHLLGGMPNAVMTLDNTGTYEITPEVFEAFSYAEPITTNMPGFG